MLSRIVGSSGWVQVELVGLVGGFDRPAFLAEADDVRGADSTAVGASFEGFVASAFPRLMHAT